MSQTIRFRTQELHFVSADGSCWFDIRHFDIDTERTDLELIESLTSVAEYRQDYVGPFDLNEKARPVHGPYWIERVESETFQPINADDAERLFQEWLDDPESDLTPDFEPLRSVVVPLLSSGTLYLLPELGEESMHEIGHILDAFTEVLAISRPQATLSVIVLSGD